MSRDTSAGRRGSRGPRGWGGDAAALSGAAVTGLVLAFGGGWVGAALAGALVAVVLAGAVALARARPWQRTAARRDAATAGARRGAALRVPSSSVGVLLTLQHAAQADRVDVGRQRHWARMQATAEDSAQRFHRTVDRLARGPLRRRLREAAAEVDAAVERVRALCQLGLDLELELSIARARARVPLRDRRDEVEARVQEIDASLASAVALALELAMAAADDRAGADVDALVGELASLRDAMGDLRAQEG